MGVALGIEVFMFVEDQRGVGGLQRDVFFTHLALGVAHQYPAVLDVGQGLAGGEDRVGRVQPPHLAVDFGTDDGVVRRISARNQ